ncbi:f23d6dce-03c5-4962-8d4c-6463d21d989a [Sclerotinia trifoliorum]|uniref:F23d6dce-03c5-4962-8d4c-6463d21d989a n=1 Tax=Sclerotinia trifoliorum TaxID=28548 RepID=A0A8H2VSI6_9HELO|nr:f23d6dce-03c5-4962-8d4c-6463d21d989a [Sclerotinia trifoliorum]
MKVVLFISALAATLTAAAPLEPRQNVVGLWGKPTDVAVQYCYNDFPCINAREAWQSCQVSTLQGQNTDPEARNSVVAQCLCNNQIVNETASCIACLSYASSNFLVRDTAEQHAQDMCDKKTTLGQYENYVYQFGDLLQFPLILPSTWLGGTKVNLPDQMLIKG